MRHARRLAALLVSTLFVHVLWAGSGFACTVSAMAGSEHSSGAPMASMNMPDDIPDMDMAEMAMPGTTRPQAEQDPAHHHAPCQGPSAPDDCQSMMPCAPLALVSIADSPQAPGTVPSSVAALVELAPPSRVTPPELPPPRA